MTLSIQVWSECKQPSQQPSSEIDLLRHSVLFLRVSHEYFKYGKYPHLLLDGVLKIRVFLSISFKVIYFKSKHSKTSTLLFEILWDYGILRLIL